MPRSDYIDHTDDGLAKQMITFKNNIGGQLAALGLPATDQDIVQQALDAARFLGVVDERRSWREAVGLNFRFNAAGADETPAREGLVDGEQPGDDGNQSPQRVVAGDDDAGHQTNPANRTARDASVALDVGLEETAHGGNLPQEFSVASGACLRQIGGMDMMQMDSSTLWASLLWGGIGGGYLVYGWRQKDSVPLVGGVVMSLACFLPALPMSLVSIAAMAAVWWLKKQGY